MGSGHSCDARGWHESQKKRTRRGSFGLGKVGSLKFEQKVRRGSLDWDVGGLKFDEKGLWRQLDFGYAGAGCQSAHPSSGHRIGIARPESVLMVETR